MSGVTTRVMDIATPLGDGVLLFHGMRGREELGRLSEYHLDLLSPDGEIDVDAILGKNVTIKLALPDDSALFETASAAAHEAGLELVAVSPALLSLVGEDWRSDDWVFRDAGVAAVHLSTGLHADYHKSSDTADRLSRPQMLRIARFMRALVARTATPAT